MTVGELVIRRRCALLEERGANCDPYELHEDALDSIGIWDAEVLEGRCDNGLILRAVCMGDSEKWEDHGFAHHAPCRIIVLKEAKSESG